MPRMYSPHIILWVSWWGVMPNLMGMKGRQQRVAGVGDTLLWSQDLLLPYRATASEQDDHWYSPKQRGCPKLYVYLSYLTCLGEQDRESKKPPGQGKCNRSHVSIIAGLPALCPNAWTNTKGAQYDQKDPAVALGHQHVRVCDPHLSRLAIPFFKLYRSLHSQQAIVGNTCNIYFKNAV